jgi:acyl-CoA hydrolase
MKTIAESETIYTELMIPSNANFGDKVHGGIILSIMDKVAYVCASKHSGSYVVTVAVEGVEFLSPVEVGDLLTIKASINYVGNTTMIVGMLTECFNPRTGHIRHTNSCYFTMAAKNDNGTLKKVPALIVSSHQQLVRFCECKLIRDFSKKKREVLKNNLSDHSYDEMKMICQSEKCVFDLD